MHIDRALQSSVCTCNLCVLGRIKRVDSRLEFGVRHFVVRTYTTNSTVGVPITANADNRAIEKKMPIILGTKNKSV